MVQQQSYSEITADAEAPASASQTALAGKLIAQHKAEQGEGQARSARIHYSLS